MTTNTQINRQRAQADRNRDRGSLLEDRRKLRYDLGGPKNLLTVPDKEGFVRRWVLDAEDRVHGNRIEYAKKLGWTVVTDLVEFVGDENVTERNKTPESGARVYAGDGKYLVLMEIPEEIREVDRQLKAEEIIDTEDDLRRQPQKEGFYGVVKLD